MNCPACGTPIDPAEIIKERQREIAKRKRPGSANNNRNPAGRPAKPKPERKSS